MKKELGRREQKAIGILSLTLFLLFCLFCSIFVGIPIGKNAKSPEKFRSFIDSLGSWSKLIYVGLCFLQVLVAIIPGGPIEIAGGYAFGGIEATILSTIGLSLGSICVFFLVRKFGQRLLEIFFSKEKITELKFLKTNKKRDIIILLLFLAPGTPKDLLCFFCGLTDMPFSLFFLIATFARIPAALISSIGGSAMGEKSYTLAIIIALVILALSLIGIVFYKKMINKHAFDEK